MTTINSINSTVLIILLAAGLMMGLAFAGTDLLNPRTSSAEANRLNIEATHQQAVYELQERLDAAKTDAEVQAIQREQGLLDAQYQHDIQILAQDVVNKQRMADTTINLGVFAVTATGIVAAIIALIIAIAKAITILRSASTSQPAITPSYTTPEDQPAVTSSRSIPTKQVAKPVSENESYDLLESTAQRYARRLAERQQELTAQKELKEMAVRMKTVLNPANMSKESYNKLPLAGD